jgi:hypothetical protein
MKQFLKLSISFLIVLFTLIFALVESSEFIVNKNSVFKLNTDTRYLVLGHSHPECAFNDSLIDNFKNLSQSGESYYYTYFKTKKIIQQNPSIETVFIEFTNNQINESMNDWIWKEKSMSYRYPKYSPFMNLSDKGILAKNNLSGYFNSTSLSFKYNFGRIRNRNFDYSKSVGGYLSLKRDKTDYLVNNMKKNNPKSEKLGISEYNIKYLTKIIDLCEEHGKKVILIRSPQHSIYSGYSNERLYQKVRNNHFSSIEYLDFSKFPLSNSEFGDLEHLNHKGAKVFSIWFAQLLNMNILEKSNKQEFINKEIKARTHSRVSKGEFHP